MRLLTAVVEQYPAAINLGGGVHISYFHFLETLIGGVILVSSQTCTFCHTEFKSEDFSMEKNETFGSYQSFFLFLKQEGASHCSVHGLSQKEALSCG